MKIDTEGGLLTGGISGVITAVGVNWMHILEQSIETGILALVGGICGAAGGLLIAWLAKKFFKINRL